MKKGKLMFVPVFLLAAVLLCAGCSRGKATTMQLMKTEGSVGITDAEKKSIEPKESLMLYSGYSMETEEASYAWINLDSVKLTKMDENSRVGIQKDGEKLEVQVDRGKLFFNVTEPLKEEETLDIHTSTMAVGIRGTCGWVNTEDKTHAQVSVLEGTVTVTAFGSGETVKVSDGETAEVVVSEDGEVTIRVTKFKERSIPRFVLDELEQDEELAGTILDASGLDVLNPPTEEELAREAYEEILEEYLDAQQNALPYDEYSENWEEMRGNLETNLANYPDLCTTYFNYYASGNYPLYHAYYDLDQNGTDELFIGVEWYGRTILLDVYAFDGEKAVSISGYEPDPEFEVEHSTVTGDGLFIDARGNGGMTSGIVYRLGPDGFTLERVTDENVPQGIYNQLDLSDHGGEITGLLQWAEMGTESPSGTEENINYDDYVGDFSSSQSGTSLGIQPNGGGYVLSVPRPGDPTHSDTYDLEVKDGAFQVVSWQTGRPVLILTPQEGELLVESTGEDEYLDYLSGRYSPR